MTSSETKLEAGSAVLPAKGKVRIQALDVIRGISILGILAVNADGFAAPKSASLNPSMWLFPNVGWTATSYWLMDAFFHDKFVTLFSLLFGVSLFLVGGERSDKRRGRLLWRRLGALFLFAMLHGFCIWWGDILALYAVTGVVMTFFQSWRPKTLMVVGVVLFAIMGCRGLPTTLLPFSPSSARAQAATRTVPDKLALAKRREKLTADLKEGKSSWTGAERLNRREYLGVLSGYRFGLPATLGLMMIGLSLFKSGYLAGRSSTRRYVAVACIGATALATVAYLLWRKDVVGTEFLATDNVVLLLAPVVSLAYAAMLILALRAGASTFLAPVAAAGRMAFTNYLSQSIIMTSIFYGGRGGLMGEVNRPVLWGIVGAVWVLQLIWSPLWLRHFEMGPFEWVWRCLTYGRRVPIVKQA